MKCGCRKFSTILLDNAVKYSREKGEIRLHAEQGDNGEIVLSVSDSGVGIGKNDLPRIFERFYRADKARSPESIRRHRPRSFDRQTYRPTARRAC